jgi:hypothetical protein
MNNSDVSNHSDSDILEIYSYTYINSSDDSNNSQTETSSEDNYLNNSPNLIINSDNEDLSNDINGTNQNNESNNSNDSNESNEQNSSEESILCQNFILCKQQKKHLNFCNDCFLYFYKKLNYIPNLEKNTCPICLSSDEDNVMINIYLCSHSICYNCIYDVYWDKKYLDNKPITILNDLEILWKNFLKTYLGRLLQSKILYKLDQSCDDNFNNFNSEYNKIIITFNIKKISKKILSNLKDLIFYELSLMRYIRDQKYKKYLMKKSLDYCPYCRASHINNINILI